MTRKQMKAQAKSLMRNSKPKPVLVTIVYVVLLMAFAVLSYKLVDEAMVNAYSSILNSMGIYDANGFLVPDAFDRLQNFDYDAFYSALMREGPTPMARLLDLLLLAVEAVIGAGFVIFTLRTIDGSGASYWNLFDGFAMFFRIIWLYIVEGFFIFLWFLLFFFPGIIAMYRYRMAIYLLLEHPEMSVMDCIRESKRLMSGHKWELFVFDLSFIGWALLIGFVDGFGASLGITLLGVSVLGYVGYVFLLPYMDLSYSLYYRQLTAVPASGAGDEWTPEL
ncbi:MAG: DUF975 family protein [Christensenellales bacterium]